VKKAEDGNGLILRFYEWAGKNTDVQVTLPAGATGAAIVNLMEHSDGSPLAITGGNQISMPIHPFEISTLRVDYLPHTP
jgi:alpha-mannosidase